MTKSIFHGVGYYYNDDRASGGKFSEDDTLACSHCSQGLLKTKWKEHGGLCFICSKPLCPKCAARAQQFGCEGPEVKKIEQAVDEAYRRQQNAKVLGI